MNCANGGARVELVKGGEETKDEIDAASKSRELNDTVCVFESIRKVWEGWYFDLG
jgi:hypothetical protein